MSADVPGEEVSPDAAGLRVSAGGIVSVDTGSLREAASALAALSSICSDLARDGEHVARLLVPHLVPGLGAVELAFASARGLDRAAADADRLVRGLELCAAAFDIVETETRRAAAELAGHDVSAAALGMQLTLLRSVYDGQAVGLADMLLDSVSYRQIGGAWTRVARAATALGPWAQPALLIASGVLGAAAGASRLGTVSGSPAPLGGPGRAGGAAAGPGSQVAAVRADGPRLAPTPQPLLAAPSSLHALAQRVPRGDDQIRVERYARPGGASRFVLYVAGTRSPAGFGGVEPWDMASNVGLYLGEGSASYAAVAEALRQAGATAEDPVVAVGYSQGAAITSQLAMSGAFRVEATISFGSPVAADLPADVLDVNVRHTDDLVPLLQGGGHPVRTGAEGSVIVERPVHPGPGLPSASIEAHDLDHYIDTAAIVDASPDTQLEGLRVLLGELDSDTPAGATTYLARRPDGPDPAR